MDVGNRLAGNGPNIQPQVITVRGELQVKHGLGFIRQAQHGLALFGRRLEEVRDVTKRNNQAMSWIDRVYIKPQVCQGIA